MRTSLEIRAEIERKRDLIRKLQSRLEDQYIRIDLLKNTLTKAMRKEELERFGVCIKVISCEEIDPIGTTTGFLIKSSCGLSWINLRRLKVGSIILKTEGEVQLIKNINKECREKTASSTSKQKEA